MTKNAISTLIVNVPLNAAYGIWSNFEKFPEFLNHVHHVSVNGRRMKWQTSHDTNVSEWEAQILELSPPRRIAWVTHRHGYPQHVVVSLREIGTEKTEVTLGAQYQSNADRSGCIGPDIELYLRQFKSYAETGKVDLVNFHPSTHVSSPWDAGGR